MRFPRTLYTVRESKGFLVMYADTNRSMCEHYIAGYYKDLAEHQDPSEYPKLIISPINFEETPHANARVG